MHWVAVSTAGSGRAVTPVKFGCTEKNSPPEKSFRNRRFGNKSFRGKRIVHLIFFSLSPASHMDLRSFISWFRSLLSRVQVRVKVRIPGRVWFPLRARVCARVRANVRENWVPCDPAPPPQAG